MMKHALRNTILGVGGIVAVGVGIGAMNKDDVTKVATVNAAPPAEVFATLDASVTATTALEGHPGKIADDKYATTAGGGPGAGHATTYRTLTVTEKITTRDATLAAGVKRVHTPGVAGVATLTYRVTVNDGVDGTRTLVRRMVMEAPVTQVVLVGTKTAQRCDPNYGGCVPIASDVDCAGGSGNGPAYVRGPVDVIGTDIYKLDADHDGVGCE
jgi:hypothetical protein